VTGTLSTPGCAHPACYTPAGGLLAPPPPPTTTTGFADPAPHPHTRSKDRQPKRAHRFREVETSGTTLTEIFGIGPILVAKIIGAVGNVARLPTKANYFVSYCGTAPVEASSAEVVRHRLSSLAANPHLNRAPCIWPPSARPGRTLGAGVTTARRSGRASLVRRRALGCLKRRI
jgi:transposase